MLTLFRNVNNFGMNIVKIRNLAVRVAIVPSRTSRACHKVLRCDREKDFFIQEYYLPSLLFIENFGLAIIVMNIIVIRCSTDWQVPDTTEISMSKASPLCLLQLHSWHHPWSWVFLPRLLPSTLPSHTVLNITSPLVICITVILSSFDRL